MANRTRMKRRQRSALVGIALIGVALAPAVAAPTFAQAPVASISAWEAARFRSWSFIPYWTSASQITSFGADRVYDHLSDVLYFSGVKPREDGSLSTSAAAAQHLTILKNQQAQFGFRYHMSMFDAVANAGESSSAAVERVWNGITSNPTTRATFVNNVKNLLTANNMTGFNLDWERPNTVAEWGNYTQLAKDMQAAFPASWEVSVDDYGSTDSTWDNSPIFDAGAYDQIGMMAYHYTATSQASFANGKKNLTQQGAAKAFKDSQIIIGMGTWGDAGPTTIGLKDIVAANPNLPADASSFTGTVKGTTGTWDIVSRYEVRDNVQLALNRGMPGVMWWALNYDATNKMSLAQVAQHYAMVKKNIPDLTLDGKVNAADAAALADNMGTNTTATGMTTQAQFESFYMNGNWEKGDHDANGFINQADADWLAGRYAALGVALPDRLAYTGTFEKLTGGVGVIGRWAAVRGPGNQLPETGNFTQHNAGFLSYGGAGPGAGKHASDAVTFRNQNAAEAAAGVNAAPRMMRVDLETPIDLGAQGVTYISFLIRQNTAGLLPSQLASPDRTLALELQDAAGQNQYDFAFKASQSQVAIRSQADAAGDDVGATSLAPNVTYLFVGKISGNGAGANTLQAMLCAPNATVGNFTDPNYPWMLTAHGGADFNPTITQLQFTSLFENNATISNVWVGSEANFFTPPMPGDFNADGTVDAADLAVWAAGVGMTEGATHWQGDANADGMVDGADYLEWQRHLGMTAAPPRAAAIPEPGSLMLLFVTALATAARRAVR